MSKTMKLFLAGSATAALIAATLPAMAYTGETMAKDAKITMKQARSIALKAHPEKSLTKNWRRKQAEVACAIPSTSRAAR